ncbi:hypothetical protein CYMTET_50666 [Cymbomonas tetramitiformis]|uniref:Uncharacterized protein n=1 Tax=Cymbomonas tetramitiformis TaxID=36881 RepID=A0AAE0ESK5_9CHLO|nr:hypothetical protein CYMTET_50666 [Cymbomonas tetramitiformis]
MQENKSSTRPSDTADMNPPPSKRKAEENTLGDERRAKSGSLAQQTDLAASAAATPALSVHSVWEQITGAPAVAETLPAPRPPSRPGMQLLSARSGTPAEVMRLVSGDGPWKGLAVTDRALLEAYVQARVNNTWEEKEAQLRDDLGNKISAFIKGTDLDAIAGAITGKTLPKAATPPPASAAKPPQTLPAYRLEWYHDCTNTHCSTEGCHICSNRRHHCGKGPSTMLPPPVIPYASAYWMNKRGPPVADNVSRRKNISHHVRARCGQVAMVRVMKTDTGEVATEATDIRLEASLLGPYCETSTSRTGQDVTFARDNFTEEEYSKEMYRLKTGLAFSELTPDAERPGYFFLNEAMTFMVSSGRNEKFRLGVQAAAGSGAAEQPDGRPWSQLMIKSELFEVHNIRSIHDRAPELLPQDETVDIKLLKSVGSKANELLQKIGVRSVKDLLVAYNDPNMREQLKRILRREIDNVVEHARTAVPLLPRMWQQNVDGASFGITFLPEYTDKFGVLTVNQPWQFIMPDGKVFQVPSERGGVDSSLNSIHSLPAQPMPLNTNMLELLEISLQSAKSDWAIFGHPNWRQMTEEDLEMQRRGGTESTLEQMRQSSGTSNVMRGGSGQHLVQGDAGNLATMVPATVTPATSNDMNLLHQTSIPRDTISMEGAVSGIPPMTRSMIQQMNSALVAEAAAVSQAGMLPRSSSTTSQDRLHGGAGGETGVPDATDLQSSHSLPRQISASWMQVLQTQQSLGLMMANQGADAGPMPSLGDLPEIDMVPSRNSSMNHPSLGLFPIKSHEFGVKTEDYGVVQYPPKVIPSAKKFLQKVADMSNKQRADDLPAKYIKKQAEKYCVDKRPVITAEDPPALISKLGVPTEGSGDKEGIHIPLHVRALTGLGPAADRTILVHGEGLGKVVTLRETACTLAGQFLVKEEHNHPLGHLVDKIKKGARKESERDAGLREVLLLEAVSPTAAQAILQNPYDFGVPTTHIWLPSKNQTEESTKTGVVVMDYKQVLFTTHRAYLVEAIAAHIQKLTASTNKLESLKDIFRLHVGTGQWAPSTWEDPATLIQWKRNGNRTINHYCVLTQPAYEALHEAGQQGTQTISVLAGINKEGKKLYTSVELEVGRVEEAAKSAVRKTAGRADAGAIPHEVTKTLGDLAQQLKTFNDELPLGILKLRELQLTEDEKTADRHRELLILLGSVVTTQKESTEALIREVQRTTSSIKTLADVLTSRYTVPIGKEHPATAPPQEGADSGGTPGWTRADHDKPSHQKQYPPEKKARIC